ncbi:FUSC family protein [Falsibacillus albus]|nr:FUSC family protein [Falsibacillus albus]
MINIFPMVRHWFARLSATDPGLVRLFQSTKVILSVILAIFTTSMFLKMAGYPQITPAILSGVAGMMGILVVMDETEKEKKWTTVMLGFSSAAAVTLGTFLAKYAHAADLALLLVVFGAFYLQKFGVRYFSLCMISFISIYFSSLLKLQFNQVPWFYAAISIGIIYAFLFNFVFLKDKPEKILKRSMNSFHKQSNLTLSLIKDAILDPIYSQRRLKTLQKNVTKLNEYARVISGQLGSTDPGRIWPGIKPNQLRLYVFDTEMLIQTFLSAAYRLKMQHALEQADIRQTLSRVAQALLDAEVLRDEYTSKNLEEAERTIQDLRKQLNDLRIENRDDCKWLYLVRRVESIANHVIDGAYILQEARNQYYKGNFEEAPSKASDKPVNNDDHKEKNDQAESKGMQPSTKKAFQALLAGALSVIIGYSLSPAHQYWILLTAYVVLLGTETVGRTVMKAIQRSVGTLIGAIIGFLLAHSISGQSLLEITLLFCCIFMAFYFLPVSYAVMSFWITMMISIMYDLLLGGITEKLLQDRVIDTVIGAGLALFISAILFPLKTKEKIVENVKDFLGELDGYTTGYFESFIGERKTINLADSAFQLDQKLNLIRTNAEPLQKIPGRLNRTGIERWMTILVAINYYAKHLVASTSRRTMYESDQELMDTICSINEVMKENIHHLCELIDGKRGLTVKELNRQREWIERYPDKNRDYTLQHSILIHNLYYVWRINKSIIKLAVELGAAIEKQDENIQED